MKTIFSASVLVLLSFTCSYSQTLYQQDSIGQAKVWDSTYNATQLIHKWTVGGRYIDLWKYATNIYDTVNGKFLPLVFPSIQTVNASKHSIIFSNLNGINFNDTSSNHIIYNSGDTLIVGNDTDNYTIYVRNVGYAICGGGNEILNYDAIGNVLHLGNTLMNAGMDLGPGYVRSRSSNGFEVENGVLTAHDLIFDPYYATSDRALVVKVASDGTFYNDTIQRGGGGGTQTIANNNDTSATLSASGGTISFPFPSAIHDSLQHNGGVTNLNGLTVATQTFSVTTTTDGSHTTPTVTSSGSNHDFNFPMANGTLTTAGVISFSEFNFFSEKLDNPHGTGFVKVTSGVVSTDGTTYVPATRTLTINGTPQDLSANRSWSVGTVTAVTVNALSPLFTSSTATNTTTPVTTFTLTPAAAHKYLGNNTGSSAAPAYNIIDYTELSGTPTIQSTINGTTIANGNSYTITAAPSGSASGDLTGSYPSPTLVTVNATPATYGNSTNVAQITVDSKGRATTVTNVGISYAWSNLTSIPATTLTGDITSTVTPGTSGAATLATVNSNVGSFGSATQVGTFTVNGKGLITAAGNTTISGVAPGGSAGGDLTGTYPSPTLATSGVTAGTYGGGAVIPVITVDAKGRATTVTTVTSTPAYANVTGTPTITTTVNGTTIANNTSNTITASANTLTTTTLNPLVVNSSLTSVGTLVSGSIPYSLLTGTPTIQTTINGVTIANNTSNTVTAAAGTLTGTTLNSTVTSSSLTSLGTLTALIMGGDITMGANNITMTGILGATGARLTKGWFTDLQVTNAIAGSVTGNAGTATVLATARSIYGNSFDGSASLAQIIASTYGGTGNGFTKFSGAATTEKTYTLPNANCNVLTDNAAVTVAQGGTSLATLTAHNMMIGAGTSAVTFLAPGTSANIVQSNGTDFVSNAMSGDVTIGSTGVTAIGASKVTNAMLAGSIDLTTKVTGALPSANVGSLTGAQVGVSGLSATGSPSSSTYLRGDNTWAAVSGSGTVTSVTLALPTDFTGGSTITTSGTWTVAHSTLYTITDAANFVYNGTNGNMQTVTLGAARTFTFSNLVANVTYKFFVNHGSAAYQLTWGTTVKSGWNTAGAPSQSAANNVVDYYQIEYDGTSTWVTMTTLQLN